MAAAIALRGDCDSGLLRELAKQSEDADQVRRLHPTQRGHVTAPILKST